MSVKAVRMIDTIGQNLGSIVGFDYWQQRPVLSYTTRHFAATHAQRAQFKHFKGIDQAPENVLFDGAVVKDAEPGAAFNSNLAALAASGAHFVAYTFLANLVAAKTAVGRTGKGSNVKWWLADWNLSEAAALDYLGTHPDTVAVQWASPTENPNTVVPGTGGRTIRGLNVDLSVGLLDFWLPAAPKPKPAQHSAEGIWKGAYSLDVKAGKWDNHGTPGENVKQASEPAEDYAVVGVNLHTGQHRIKGLSRDEGLKLLGR
jgi:hypothetical protein